MKTKIQIEIEIEHTPDANTNEFVEEIKKEMNGMCDAYSDMRPHYRDYPETFNLPGEPPVEGNYNYSDLVNRQLLGMKLTSVGVK